MLGEFSGFIATAFIMASYAPQIIKSYKTQETKDLSLLMILFGIIGNVFWLLNGHMTGNNALMLSAAFMVVLPAPLLLLKLENEYGFKVSAVKISKFALIAFVPFIL